MSVHHKKSINSNVQTVNIAFGLIDDRTITTFDPDLDKILKNAFRFFKKNIYVTKKELFSLLLIIYLLQLFV